MEVAGCYQGEDQGNGGSVFVISIKHLALGLQGYQGKVYKSIILEY